MTFVWDDARVFLAIQRTASLSGAGRQLRVNQSTIGRRLAILEEAIGARLFDHTPDGYLLTTAGERFLAHAERMESEADDVAREIAGEEARLTGVLRVTAADAFGLRALTPVLGRFHQRYPEIELSLISDGRVLSLSKRESDIGIRSPRPKEPSLFTRRVAELAHGLYASRSYVQARGTPRLGEDFEGHDFIGYDEEYGADTAWLSANIRRGRVVMRQNRTLGILELCRMGIGLALLPCYLGDPEADLVRVLGPEETAVKLEQWLAVHKDMRHTARVRTCADFIAAELAARAEEFSGVRRRRAKR